MTDDQLYGDPSLVEFYDIENSAGHDFDFCIAFAKTTKSVLDLGCGTGRLAAMLADGRRVTGIDPAAAMLDVARNRHGGERVLWIEADARTARLGETFDIVLLTGHAFQCFLTDDDAAAVLKTIAVHLAPDGKFIFDSRNPAREEWREWVPGPSDRMVIHPRHGEVKAWNDVTYDDATDITTYETFYEIPAIGRTLSASSKIRFIPKARLEELMAEAGLRAERWLGDWTGAPYGEEAEEIIPVGGLA